MIEIPDTSGKHVNAFGNRQSENIENQIEQIV